MAPVFRGREIGKVREYRDDAAHDERGHQELAVGVPGPGAVPDGKRVSRMLEKGHASVRLPS